MHADKATKRPCGCHADPLVFGHSCGATGPFVSRETGPIWGA